MRLSRSLHSVIRLVSPVFVAACAQSGSHGPDESVADASMRDAGNAPVSTGSGGGTGAPSNSADAFVEATRDAGPNAPLTEAAAIVSDVVIPDPSSADELIGWAFVSGDGVPTTTGGQGGRTVRAVSADELIDFAGASEPLIIELEGDYSVSSLNVASNKTLIGLGSLTTIHGGIRIRGSADTTVENVIVKNIRIDGASSGADGDAMHIYYAHHVWVDHCEIFDAPDGNLDIVHAANWVTVSWTKFHYTGAAPAPEHRFSNLIGHTDDNEAEDTGRLKVTFHHDWWAAGVVERMPRVRFGDVHVFNSYYSAAGNNYAIGAGFESRLAVEQNYFDAVNDPHIFYNGETTAEIVARDNVYQNTTGEQQSGQGSAFTPPYPYSPDPAEDVPQIVMQGAGPR